MQLASMNPDAALNELDRVESEESLLGFVQAYWSQLEPGRAFVPGKPVEAICEHLEAVTKGQIRKLLINVPPGCMKSMLTNVFWPAWEWGPQKRPDLRYVSFSYSQDLTIRDNRKARQIITCKKYQQAWGDIVKLSDDQDAKIKFENSARGWKLATSVHGVGTGERGDRVILDDPHNIKEAESLAVRESTLQFFTEILPTRVNDPDTSVFVVIMQRVHARDVSGLILARQLGYEYLCLPMEYEPDHPFPCRNSIGFTDWRSTPGELLWPQRFSEQYLGELKESLRSWGGGYAEAGQLQQRPAPRGGGMFQRKWWKFFHTEATLHKAATRPNGCDDSTPAPAPARFDWVLLSCDAAFKDKKTGSRVSLQVIGGRGPYRYVLDNVTKHMTFRETCKAILEMDEKRKPMGGLLHKWPQINRFLIEDKANGTAIIDTLRELVSGVIAINPEGGKESRANAIQPAVESGHVLLPDGAPWLEDYISEFAAFPVSTNDDQVDSLSQAMIYMTANSDMARAISLSKL